MPNKPRMTADDLKYQTESDLRSLITVDEIRADKKRFARAMKMARDQMAALKKVK